jgi:hypothetical protein
MTAYAFRRFGVHNPGRWLVVGFVAGALAVLLFHQTALAMLHTAGLVQNAPFQTRAVGPWGVPQVWSITFWGGVWGFVMAYALRRWDGPSLLVLATAFGAIFPTLVAWFVVAPLHHQPMAAGFQLHTMWVGPVLNGLWGLGTGIGLLLFGRAHLRGLRI